jgi:periplasmic protein TonB
MAAGSSRARAWNSGSRRALEYAIAASLALHALALRYLPALAPERSMAAPPPLEARLEPARPVAAPKPTPPPPAVEAKPSPLPELTRPAPRPTPRPKPRSARKLVVTKPAPAPEPVAQPAPEPEPAAAPPPQPQPAVAAAPPAPASAPPAAVRVDAASLAAQYRAALIAEAARYKHYPRFARDNGWEGTAEVHMVIGSDGAIASIIVTRGTGYAILDQQALDMIRSAKSQTAIPEALRGKAFSVDVPVIFNLRDADG